jgi:hypothetical protein
MRQVRFHEAALYIEVTVEDVGVIQKSGDDPRCSALTYKYLVNRHVKRNYAASHTIRYREKYPGHCKKKKKI